MEYQGTSLDIPWNMLWNIHGTSWNIMEYSMEHAMEHRGLSWNIMELSWNIIAYTMECHDI